MMNFGQKTPFAALATVAMAATLVVSVAACTNNKEKETKSEVTSPAAQTQQQPSAATPTDLPSQPVTELKIQDLKVGTGTEATTGKQVTVHYTGWLIDHTKFDSSYDHGQPFPFTLGAGQVIKGWDQGVAGMKVGGKRRLQIPPQLAYGDRGVGPIKPGSTLIFDVELLSVN